VLEVDEEFFQTDGTILYCKPNEIKYNAQQKNMCKLLKDTKILQDTW